MYHLGVHRLAQPVLEYIRKHALLRPGDRAGIAVSGGADSVALLRLLLELRGELGIVPAIVHFNHELRGEESGADEQFVRELAARHGVRFVTSSGDVRAHAAEKHLSIETAGRQLRYEFFRRLMLAGDFDKIATAHTLDDQAETVLLKLTRGAGTRGLAGIYPKVNIHQSATEPTTPPPNTACSHQAVVRPLLGTQRATLEEYLRDLNQPWREDSSNRNLHHMRNRVRHEVLPILGKLINPRIREALSEAAEIARAEEDYWAQQNHFLQQTWKTEKGQGILDLKLLRSQPLAVQRRLVRAGAELLCLHLEFQHVEQVLGLDHEGAQVSLPAGWTATLHKGMIHIDQQPDRGPKPYEYELKIPGRITVPEAGVVIEAKVVSPGECISEALLDTALAGRNLTVRSWRPGDCFWPLHSKSPQKLKDLLQSRHITGKEKRCWPVIAGGDEIVWVRDLGVGRDSQAKNGPGVFIRTTPLSD